MKFRDFWVAGATGTLALAFVSGASLAQSSDQAPGTVITIDLSNLDKPYATPAKASPSRRIDRPRGTTLDLLDGFTATLFAENLDHPRNMKVASNGDVLLVESNAGKVTLLRDADGDGRAEMIETFVDGFNRPYGLDITEDALYIGDLEGLWRLPYTPGETQARAEAERITPDGAFGRPNGHWTRNVAVSPDRSKIYVAIGSAGNIDVEPEPRATIQVFNMDGSGQRTYASGLRNAVGIHIYPGTNDVYTVVNERDGLGDELVPDYLTKVQEGGFYGWPYSYMGDNPQPGFADRRPDLVASAIVPDLPLRSHTAPLGFAFYDDDQFPEEYRGGAFIALHGSWNAGEPRGYNVVYAPFENGSPTGSYIVFASGFWLSGNTRAEVWGRPADVEVAQDGSLLIADDVGMTVWRVSYTGQ